MSTYSKIQRYEVVLAAVHDTVASTGFMTYLLPENCPNQANDMFNIILYRRERDLNRSRMSKYVLQDIMPVCSSACCISAISSSTSGWFVSPFAWKVARILRALSGWSLAMRYRGDSGQSQMNIVTMPGQMICSHRESLQDKLLPSAPQRRSAL